jgi:hypothetical protein
MGSRYARPYGDASPGGSSCAPSRFRDKRRGDCAKRTRLRLDLGGPAAVDEITRRANLSGSQLGKCHSGPDNAGEKAKLIHCRDPFGSARA